MELEGKLSPYQRRQVNGAFTKLSVWPLEIALALPNCTHDIPRVKPNAWPYSPTGKEKKCSRNDIPTVDVPLNDSRPKMVLDLPLLKSNWWIPYWTFTSNLFLPILKNSSSVFLKKWNWKVKFLLTRGGQLTAPLRGGISTTKLYPRHTTS